MCYPVSSQRYLLLVTLLVVTLWCFSSPIHCIQHVSSTPAIELGFPFPLKHNLGGESNEEALIRYLHFIPLYHNALMKRRSYQHRSFLRHKNDSTLTRNWKAALLFGSSFVLK